MNTNEMACAIRDEPLLTLAEAARLIPPRNGRTVSTVTLWRWCAFGLYGVRLEHVQFGRRVFTSAAAVARFGQAVATARSAARDAARDDSMGSARPGRRRPGRRSATADARRRRAEKVLDEAGVR